MHISMPVPSCIDESLLAVHVWQRVVGLPLLHLGSTLKSDMIYVSWPELTLSLVNIGPGLKNVYICESSRTRMLHPCLTRLRCQLLGGM